MNIYLGKHFEELIRKQVETGRYANASEVVREALRQYEVNEDNLARLRARIDDGLASLERGEGIDITDLDTYFENLKGRIVARAEKGQALPVHAK